MYAHYGVRTRRYKLIYCYGEALGAAGAIDEPQPPGWELFNLEEDPTEMNSAYDRPNYTSVVAQLKAELHRLRAKETRLNCYSLFSEAIHPDSRLRSATEPLDEYERQDIGERRAAPVAEVGNSR